MNTASNRSAERKDVLFNLLGVEDEKHKILIKNEITEIKRHLNGNFIAGVIDGDGSFFISFSSPGSLTTQRGAAIKTGFNITNDKASKALLESIKKHFKDIGSIQEGSKNELIYTVNGLNQINDVLIPFMDENPIFSERASHYQKFKTVSLMLKNENPLTLESKLKIVELAYDMNKKGKHRNLSKKEYTTLLLKMEQS
jgi:hypothetical protein